MLLSYQALVHIGQKDYVIGWLESALQDLKSDNFQSVFEASNHITH
jgi:hypothetical protein